MNLYHIQNIKYSIIESINYYQLLYMKVRLMLDIIGQYVVVGRIIIYSMMIKYQKLIKYVIKMPIFYAIRDSKN
jgi:hypothetical protein